MNSNIKHIWSIVCQKSIVDSATNNISLFDVLETINVNVKPDTVFDEKKPIGLPMNFEVISYWGKIDKEKASHEEVKIIIYSPSNKELLNANISFEVPKDKESYRTITKMNFFPLVGPGEYKIDIHQKAGKEYGIVSEIPVRVHVVKS